ncbi:hypothetical protein JL720_17148 [Aureococcus anophagefferens]|nr:hypothetical protein JL720_17148 [Aureococcus anophagefferens]
MRAGFGRLPGQYLDGYDSPNNRSTSTNAHVLDAARDLATIARALAATDGSAKQAYLDDAEAHDAVADAIAATLSSEAFFDGTYLAWGAGAPKNPSAAAPGLRAAVANKTFGRAEPAYSCMGAYWVLRALYGAALRDGDADYRAAARARRRSRAAPLVAATRRGADAAAGATATMEVWTVADKGNPTWSHPWCSAPATAVPAWLGGVAPAEGSPGRLLVRPQPGALASFELTAPTPSGAVAVALAQDAHVLNLTRARCVPHPSTAGVDLYEAIGASRGAATEALLADHAAAVAATMPALEAAASDVVDEATAAFEAHDAALAAVDEALLVARRKRLESDPLNAKLEANVTRALLGVSLSPAANATLKRAFDALRWDRSPRTALDPLRVERDAERKRLNAYFDYEGPGGISYAKFQAAVLRKVAHLDAGAVDGFVAAIAFADPAVKPGNVTADSARALLDLVNDTAVSIEDPAVDGSAVASTQPRRLDMDDKTELNAEIRGIPLLVKLSRDGSPSVKKRAVDALQTLTANGSSKAEAQSPDAAAGESGRSRRLR